MAKAALTNTIHREDVVDEQLDDFLGKILRRNRSIVAIVPTHFQQGMDWVGFDKQKPDGTFVATWWRVYYRGDKIEGWASDEEDS